MVDDLLAQGVIGTPHIVTANLAYPIEHVERIQNPALAGGALLDVGVYTLHFASMVFGNDIAAMASTVQMLPTGVDREESITLTYADGRMAVLCASAACAGDRHGVVYGSKGTLEVDNINNPQRITVSLHDQPDATRTYAVPEQITGFEYQVQTAVDCIGKGLCECEAVPHAESVAIMRQMDALRAQWGLVYPFE
jgi:predicted dehydrogenase